jgi:hypothetical protein
MVEYQCCEGPCCPHFQGELTLKMGIAWSSETVVSYHITTWIHNPENHNLNLHCCENPKSPIIVFVKAAPSENIHLSTIVK